jgi:hypothetical protein
MDGNSLSSGSCFRIGRLWSGGYDNTTNDSPTNDSPADDSAANDNAAGARKAKVRWNGYQSFGL